MYRLSSGKNLIGIAVLFMVLSVALQPVLAQVYMFVVLIAPYVAGAVGLFLLLTITLTIIRKKIG